MKPWITSWAVVTLTSSSPGCAALAARGLPGRALTSASEPAAAQLSVLRRSTTSTRCGPLTTYANARPKKFEDSQKTRYDVETHTHVDVKFTAGDEVSFECVPGFSTDGRKDGNRDFVVQCVEQGYYKPSAVCLEASLCAPVPEIPHARPTGRTVGGSVEFECDKGFSLDGEKVIPGGLGKNQLFQLKCVAFTGQYEAFTGNCKPYAFVPSSDSVRMYGHVFEALFVVSCKGTLLKSFGAGQGPPAGLDDICSKFADHISGECGSLVTQIKEDYEAKLKAREEHDKSNKQDGLPASDIVAPNMKNEAQVFCTKVWKLVEMPSASTE